MFINFLHITWLIENTRVQ